MKSIKGHLYKTYKHFGERSSRAHYRAHYKREMEGFEADTDKKPAHRIRREMRKLKDFWGCYPFQYIRYGMYKASCGLSMAEMKEYIPNYFAYYLFFPKSYKAYGILSEDKELTYRMLQSYGIAQPVLLLQFKNGTCYDREKNQISLAQADNIIAGSCAAKVFLKPTQGLGGRGILVFKKESGYVDDAGNLLSAQYIKEQLGDQEDYILQEGLEQHADLNSVYPNAVNTFRIMTRLEAGKAVIMFAMLRMGQGGSHLDNASQTGLVCKIDVSTGEFDADIHLGHGRTVGKHPDTGFSFEGYVFPHWPNIKEFVAKAAEKMESIPMIGWDIALSTTGPQVIEINAGAGLEYLQDCHGGVRTAYGITDPTMYWNNADFALKDV